MADAITNGCLRGRPWFVRCQTREARTSNNAGKKTHSPWVGGEISREGRRFAMRTRPREATERAVYRICVGEPVALFLIAVLRVCLLKSAVWCTCRVCRVFGLRECVSRRVAHFSRGAPQVQRCKRGSCANVQGSSPLYRRCPEAVQV